MAKEIVRLALAGCVALAAAGCKQDPQPGAGGTPATKPADPGAVAAASGTGAPAGRLPADQQTTKLAAPAVAPRTTGPAVAGAPEVPLALAPSNTLELTAIPPGSIGIATQPAAVDVPLPHTGPGTSGPDAGSNALFTVPPSRGPVAHRFQQLTLIRSGPSGDLEMQLTGDGIYRIRDHGRGKSYSGGGKLEDAQIAEWATLLKDWETLKDRYLPDPAPADADKVEIIYGGKKVVAAGNGKDNPKPFADAYRKLLELNEQAKKETEAPATPTPPAGGGVEAPKEK
jgi:hypothetical protein